MFITKSRLKKNKDDMTDIEDQDALRLCYEYIELGPYLQYCLGKFFRKGRIAAWGGTDEAIILRNILQQLLK